MLGALAMCLFLTNAVGAQAASAIPQQLYGAPVPSLCDHPAGNLVGGVLPGVPENRGGVALRGLTSNGMVATGSLAKGRKGDVAAVLSCSQGGVGWPDKIVVYDARNRILGSVDLYAITKGGRESARRIWIQKRTVFVDVVGIGREGDIACCGSASARVQLRWDAKRGVFAHRVKVYRERAKAARFVKAIKRGNRPAARRHAARDAVAKAMAVRRTARLSLGRCHGRLDDIASGWLDSVWQESYGQSLRMCELHARSRSGPYESTYGLFMERVGWRGWRVAGVLGIAG